MQTVQTSASLMLGAMEPEEVTYGPEPLPHHGQMTKRSKEEARKRYVECAWWIGSKLEHLFARPFPREDNGKVDPTKYFEWWDDCVRKTEMVVLAVDNENHKKIMVLWENEMRELVKRHGVHDRIPVGDFCDIKLPVCIMHRVLALSQPFKVILAEKNDEWSFWTDMDKLYEVPLPWYDDWVEEEARAAAAAHK